MHGHGVTHFDKKPAAVALSKGKRRAVLAVVCLALAVVMGMAVSLSVGLQDLARDLGATQAQLQQILGYSPLVSGLAVLPMVAAFALSPAAAHLSERVGPAPMIAGGLALAAAGLGVLATLG
jgi:MFS family permease